MNQKPDERRFNQLIEELKANRGECHLQLGFNEVIVIVAHVQLALRHPGNKGAPARLARKILDEVIAKLDEGAPGIGEFLRLGFDPKYDVASAGPSAN